MVQASSVIPTPADAEELVDQSQLPSDEELGFEGSDVNNDEMDGKHIRNRLGPRANFNH